MFELAEKLDHFKKPLESGLKVANMGEKTFRWEDGGDSSEAKFNYSTDEDAKLLQRLVRAHRGERAHSAGAAARHPARPAGRERGGAARFRRLWNDKRLVATAQFLPLLDRVAKNEAYIHMARERAAQIADAIRATQSEVGRMSASGA